MKNAGKKLDEAIKQAATEQAQALAEQAASTETLADQVAKAGGAPEE